MAERLIFVSGHSNALRYACIVSLGGFLFGFDASVISGVVSFIVPQFGLNDWQLGLVVGAPTLAGMIAALTAAPVADAIGRKKVLLTLAALYSISAVASALAPNFETLVAARFVGGLAFASLGIAPMYIGEIAPAERRGFLVSVNQMNIMIGFSLAYFVNYFVLQASQHEAAWVTALGLDQHAWRWMLGIEALPAFAWFFLLLLVPESPRYLVIKQQVTRARAVLARLREPAAIEPEIASIRESVSGGALARRYKISELFSPSLRLCLTVGILVGVAQQLTGINAIYFYAPSIFEQTGVGTNAAFFQATLIGIINIIATIIAMLLIDRLGRKPLLVAGLAGVIFSTALAGWGFAQATYELPAEKVAALELPLDSTQLEPMLNTRFANDLEFKEALSSAIGEQAMREHSAILIEAAIHVNSRLILIAILGFVFSFAMSLGPVMWVLFSEIFPNRIRGLALAASGFVNSISSFAVQFIFPWELSNLGIATTFYIFSVMGIILLAPIVKLLPETKGKSLEEVEKLLTGTPHAVT